MRSLNLSAEDREIRAIRQRLITAAGLRQVPLHSLGYASRASRDKLGLRTAWPTTVSLRFEANSTPPKLRLSITRGASEYNQADNTYSLHS